MLGFRVDSFIGLSGWGFGGLALRGSDSGFRVGSRPGSQVAT